MCLSGKIFRSILILSFIFPNVVWGHAPSKAWAHHPGHLRDVQHSRNTLALQLSQEHAPYDLNLGTGSWSKTTFETFYRPLSWLSLTSSVPLARLAPAESPSKVGLGDIEIGAMFTVFSNLKEGVQFSVGSGLELPTGDDHAGLGGGHTAIIPRATLSWLATKNFALTADILYSFTLDGHSHSHTPTPLAIHSKQELRNQLLLSYLQPNYFITAGASLTYGLSEPKGVGPVTAMMEGGFRFLDSWALVTNVEKPIAGEQRFDWRAAIGIRWTLPAPETENCKCEAPVEPTACDCSGCATDQGCPRS